MEKTLKARVELEVYTEDGNYLVNKVEYFDEEVKDWKASTKADYPYHCTIDKMGSININSALITASPGHWVLFAGGYVWVP